MKAKTLLLLGCALGSFTLEISAADWPQYRGPGHDGVSPEKLLKSWPADGPHQVWKQPLTDGFSSFAVSGGRAFTIVLREVDSARQEVAVGLDAHDGKELWARPLGVGKYDGGGDSGTQDNKGGDGPRTTPALDGGKVYVMSSKMVLKCLDAATGNEVWSKDLVADFGGHNIRWQCGASPLIEDGLVFVVGGGTGQSLLAFNAKDGSVAWKGEDDLMTQSTPIAATILGTRQVIFFTQKGLVAVVPKTGKVLWRQAFPFAVATAISPVVSGDIVYCSAAYNVGAAASRISKTGDTFEATQLWFNKGNSQANHWSTPVCVDGYLYGICDQAKYGKAPLKCVELATGKVMWSKENFGMGGVLYVDGQVMVLTDAGELVLVKPDSAEYHEISRNKILAGKCWNVPAISNGQLFARSTKEGVCLDIGPKLSAKLN